MTVKCPQCGAEGAEVCPACGRKAVLKGRLSDCVEYDRIIAGAQIRPVDKQTAVVCWCVKCRRFFERGKGGVRPVRCAACVPVQMEMLV